MKRLSLLKYSTLFLLMIASSVSAQITVKPIQLEPALADFKPLEQNETTGSLVYSFDNATYGDAGLNWPWNNVLVIRNSSKGQSTPRGYEIFRSKYDFMFGAQWLDEQRILFKVGDPNSSFGTYDLALFDTKSLAVETLQKGLSWKQVWPSLSGRYIAFLEGGGEVPVGEGTPASFCTLNLQTKEKKVWPGFPTGIGNLWTPDDRILFTVVGAKTDVEASQLSQLQNSAIQMGNAGDGTVSKLKDEAFGATTSFDGKWMTYFTTPLPSNEANTVTPDPTLPKPPVAPDLMLAPVSGGKPRKLPFSSSGDVSIVWRPDSSGFIFCQRRNVGRTQGKRVVEVTFNEIKANETKAKKLGSIRYFASDGIETSVDDLLWRPLKISKDNQFLLFELRQFDGDAPEGLSLQAFNLVTGQTQVWAHIGSVHGLDWREG